MNRRSLPLVLALLAAPGFAQSNSLIVLPPGQDSKPQVIVRPFTVQTIEPSVQLLPQGRYRIVRPESIRGSGRARIVGPMTLLAASEGDVWLGLEIQSRKGEPTWLEVVDVFDDSPAAKAGVKSGDKLVALAGRAVATHDSLVEILREHRPGSRLLLTVERTVKVKLGKSEEDSQALLGVVYSDDAKPKSGGDGGVTGVTLDDIVADSGAAGAALNVGDRIAAVAGSEVATGADLRSAVKSHTPGDGIELRIQRDVSVELAARPVDSSGRAIAGKGEGAFKEPPQKKLPKKQPPEKGLDPGKKDGYLWSTPGNPPAGEPGSEAPGLPLPGRKFAPEPPKTKEPKAGAKKRAVMPGDANAISAQLLDEIRALRAEVADLRREIEALREKRR